MIIANDQSTFFINGRPTFINGPRNTLDGIIMQVCVFDNFVLADEFSIEDEDEDEDNNRMLVAYVDLQQSQVIVFFEIWII